MWGGTAVATSDGLPTAPITTVNTLKNQPKLRVARVLLAIILLLILAGVLLVIQKYHARFHSYTLVQDSLKPPLVKSVSFTKPSTFAPPPGLKVSPFQVVLINTDAKSQSAGGIVVIAQPVINKSNPDLIMFDEALNKGNVTVYKPEVTSLQQYVSSRLPKYHLSFYGVSKFTSAYIKSDAISLKFNGTPQAKNAPKVIGQAVLALTQKADYSLVAYSTDKDWQANQSQWQIIINSLKIEQ